MCGTAPAKIVLSDRIGVDRVLNGRWFVIDTLLNLVFRCAHRRLTRPVTPAGRPHNGHGETYVVCLDCGKQFAYDAKEMRIGKAIDRTTDAAGVTHEVPPPRKRTRTMLAAVPSAILLGLAVLGLKRKTVPHDPRQDR
jgi:hypothetical protein